MRQAFKSIALFCITLVGSVMLFGIPKSFAWDPLESDPVGPREGTDASSPVTSLSPVQIGWIVGDSVDGYGTILHTTDGGSNWVRQGAVPDVPDVDLYDVWAADAEHAWVVGNSPGDYGVILRTTDGGSTWHRQGTAAQIPNVTIFGIHGLDRNTLWAVGGEGTILHTTDGGQTWTQQTGGTIPVVQCEGIWAIDANHAWAGGGDDDTGYGTVLRTTNGGVTWERMGGSADVFGDHRYVIKIYAADKDTAWAVGHGSIIAYTSDGGESWENQSPLPLGNWDMNNIFFVDRETGWAVADVDIVLATQDGGTQWVTQTIPPINNYLMGVHALDEQNVWIVGTQEPSSSAQPVGDSPDEQNDQVAYDYHGSVVHTEDGGSTWYTQTTPVKTQWSDVWFVDNRLRGTLTGEIAGTLMTYTMAVTSPSPQTNLVVTGSVPADTTFVDVTGGVHVATGGDYGWGYVTSPDTITLPVGETYTLIWTVELPGPFVGDLETQAHARSDSAPAPLNLIHHLHQLILPVVLKNSPFVSWRF